MNTQSELTEEQEKTRRRHRDYITNRRRRKAVRHATKVRRGKK